MVHDQVDSLKLEAEDVRKLMEQQRSTGETEKVANLFFIYT